MGVYTDQVNRYDNSMRTVKTTLTNISISINEINGIVSNNDAITTPIELLTSQIEEKIIKTISEIDNNSKMLMDKAIELDKPKEIPKKEIVKLPDKSSLLSNVGNKILKNKVVSLLK